MVRGEEKLLCLDYSSAPNRDCRVDPLSTLDFLRCLKYGFSMQFDHWIRGVFWAERHGSVALAQMAIVHALGLPRSWEPDTFPACRVSSMPCL